MKRALPSLFGWRVAAMAALFALAMEAAGAPLTTLEYKITGVQMTVAPGALSVPKGVAGSVMVQVNTGGDEAGMFALTNNAIVKAFLRGPNIQGFHLEGPPNAPLLLPPLNISGDYQLANIRLVDEDTDEVRLEGEPSVVPVQVFEEALISKVVSRPLTSDEIKEKGIYIDENNFRAVEFEVGFVLDGKTIPVKFPVVAPTFKQSTEIIPAAELEEKLARAAEINRQIASEARLPGELEQSNLNIEVQGINFQRVEDNEQELALSIPPIPALMVIPGNIGYLNQFFSVQIFTENGAPAGSGLSVLNVKAELLLPAGPDRIPATSYENPGDDPVRFARIGPDKTVQPVQKIAQIGPDGVAGTADDVERLFPGESGQAEFLVEGLQEGLHVMDLALTADLDGLAAGLVKVKGKAAGSVLVRNPKFSLAFTHPRTVRTGEPYEASATILNTSLARANQVRITLGGASLSGGVLESEETVELGDIPPGQSRTATWRVRAQRTGAISFSNLSTGEESVVGRFRLKMGIDERGVALSPDTIGMPDFVNSLPTNIIKAATRVLGQALSVSTAPQLPPGIIKTPKSIITTRVLDLAEAGQRIKYGDSKARVLADLLLDWQGNRNFNAGFDQIMRETDAGFEWREAMVAELQAADTLNATARLNAAAADFAGRNESFVVFATTDGSVEASITGSVVTSTNSARPGSLIYSGASGSWLVSPSGIAATVTLKITNEVAEAKASALFVETNGVAQKYEWTIASPNTNACYTFDYGAPAELRVDVDCDGVVDSTLAATVTAVNEKAPEVIAVLQDLTVKAGRPPVSCVGGFGENYGTVLAVMFSKPMAQNQVNIGSAYRLDNGNVANSVQIQPGARVALLNMKAPVSAIRPRIMTVSGISDARGNALAVTPQPVQSTVKNGVAIRGRVVRADGSFAANNPVTLTMYDADSSGFDCVPFIVRVAQVTSDENGFFEFDYVMAGVPYSVSATDVTGLSKEARQVILQSASADEFNRAKLEELANSPSVKGSLLAAFAVAALPEAIAKAEGLDRALLRDLVATGSAREGTETIVALRFRGRGTVIGQVLSADGVTPAAKVAVNLFPDPDSRELGRGIFSDDSGRFAFYGVPLGVFSVQAQANSGQFRTVADTLDSSGDAKSVTIVLSTNAVTMTQVGGRVVEADNGTPHQDAQVLIGKYIDGKFGNVVAIGKTDAAGYWSVTNFPAGIYDIAAISADGKRKGERRDVSTAGGASFVTITLDGRATVFGRVETSTGAPVANALVAGGDTIVRTDANGLFEMPGVPIGLRSLSAGVERNPAAGYDFPRLGSASLNVAPGADNFVVIRLNPAGRIIGRVLDVTGKVVPNIRVAIPQENGFMWVETDANGNYRFENLGLGAYTLSAPAGPVANTDVSGLLSKIRTGSEEEVSAAINDAFAIFTGAADPYLNGEGQKFNPQTWGFTRTALQFDGQTAVADIHYLREGTVSGVVLNAQGVPIGARVRLTGIGPLANGMPSMIVRGEMNTDPALGTFSFKGQALEGDWGLQAASPFYPTVLIASGKIASTPPDPTNEVLRFPPIRDVNGKLAGRVFMPNGTAASSNVNVKISYGDYEVRTVAGGYYETINIPAGGYSVEAHDPVTGFRGSASVNLQAGITNICDVRLLGRGSLTVLVRQANGSSALNASVEVSQAGFPGDKGTLTAVDGTATFHNLSESPYSVAASFVSGPTTIFGRASASVVRDQTNVVIVTLTPTATVRGQFLKRDLVTPVEFAQVAIGSLGFTATDANGRFEVKGVPLGTYRLVTQNPVTGVGATATINLTDNGQILDVRLIEQARGEVNGAVISSYGSGFVPGVTVTLSVHDGLTPSRTVTSGPDGRFSFPGTPAGSFSLRAEDPVTKLTGQTSAVLAENVSSFEANIALQSLGQIQVTVLSPDGATPHTNASVKLQGPRQVQADVDANGGVTFVDLPMGSYSITAQSLTPAESRSFGLGSAALSVAGETNNASVRLKGVGKVVGKVFASDGTTALPAATVTLTTRASLFHGLVVTDISDSGGNYTFENVPVGDYRVAATDQALGASEDGAISASGEVDTINLTLGASGSVSGRLVRANGVTAVANIDVLITFTSQSGLPGRAFVRSAADGTFSFNNVPVGNLFVQADAPDFAGMVRTSAFLAANGQSLALGDLRFDEEDPRVLAVFPAHTAADVPTTAKVDLYFNERPLATSLNADGIFVRSGTNRVSATVSLLPDPTNGVLRVVRISPAAPFESLKTYEVVVIDGDRKDPFGSVTARGPTDLVGRPLVTPFVSRFSTADNAPPELVSTFPTNSSIQIDRAAIMRFTFNEPIAAGSVVTLTRSNGVAVSGQVNLALNGLALVFTPNQYLEANATYTLSASNVRDLAGNAALGQPLTTTFTTIDTTPPQIAELKQIGKEVASSTIQIEAILAQAEPGASVRYTQDFTPIAVAVVPPYRASVTLPASGSTTIRAYAMDRFNNENAEPKITTITVVSNEPPVIAFARGNPPTGPVGNNQLFTLVLSATDDVSVTNMNVRATGLFTINTNFSSGAQRSIALTVPANAPPGSTVEFRARALDWFGLASSESVITMQTIDTAPPTLAIVGPAADTLLNPDENLSLEVASSDNGTNSHQLVVRIDALSLTQTLEVAAAPNVRGTNIFLIPLTAAPKSPTPITVSVRATDGAGNTVAVNRSFQLPDREAPKLASVAPQNGAVNQSLWLDRVAFQFTERLDTNLVSTNMIVLTNELASTLSFDVAPSADGTFVFVRPTLPLSPATVYTNIFLPGLKDTVGNALVDTDGSAWPADGKIFTFRTAAIGQILPTNNTVVTAGTDFNARIDFDSGVGADFIRFVLNTNPPVDVNIPGGATFVSTTLRAPTNSTSGRVEISAHKNGLAPYAIGGIDLVIEQPIGPPPDGNQNRPPTIEDGAVRQFEITQYGKTNIQFTMRDADHNLKLARIEGSTVANFYAVGFGAGSIFQVDFNKAPLVTTNFTVINYPPTSAPLWPGGPSIHFAMRFQSTFAVTNEGSYTFYISSDDGSILSVDGQLIVNNDGLHGMSERSATITLAPGIHSIDAAMFENGGDHGIIVNWSGPDFGKQLMRFEGIQAYWADSGLVEYRTTNEIGLLRLPLTVASATPGTNVIQVIVLDHDSNSATQRVEFITLPDLDRDMIADRDDSDIDGDSLSNDIEVAQGTDPLKADTDNDNIPDNLDARPVSPNQNPATAVESNVALLLDGANDFAEKRSPTTDLNIGDSSWTVSAWVRSGETNSRAMLIAGRYECGWNGCGSPDGNASAYWALSLDSLGRVSWSVRATGDFLNATGTNDLRNGQWHHVAGVLNRVSGELAVFVDGQMQASVPIGALGGIQDAGSPFSIGREFREGWGSPGEYFNGWINEVRVWSLARTAAELTAELTASPSPTSTGLLGYWPLHEQAGATGTNVVADANHLTLGNADASTRPAWINTFEQIGTADRVLTLSGVDPEGDPVTAIITALPAAGALYQTDDGVTRGARIAAVPAPVSNAQGKVIFAPPPGVNAAQYFSYKVSDGWADSTDARVGVWSVPIPTFDTDGDGMTDVFEVKYALNAEADDAAADTDADQLTNLTEFQRGTNPRHPDTDLDGLTDGAEIAVATDIFKRDTDGDGLTDGFDPQPLVVASGLVFEGQNSVVMAEGDSTNIVVQVISTNGHIAGLDYLDDMEAPTFSALGGIQFTNTGTNFMAWATIALNPLHDAAGEHEVKIRAASSDGKSGVFTIHVTVADNAGLAVTRWKDPVNGVWSDPARWTAGVPTAEHVAVIDEPGSYSVEIRSAIAGKGLVVNSTNANLGLYVDNTWAFPAEFRSGTFGFSTDRHLYINQTLVNRAAIAMPSRGTHSFLRGTGVVQNSGRITSYVWGNFYDGSAHIFAPLTVTASGSMVADPNAYLELGVASAAMMSGRTISHAGAYIWQPNVNPAGAVTYLEGARTEGAGALDANGASQFHVRGHLVVGNRLNLYNTSSVEGSGKLTLYGYQALRRIFNLAVEFGGGSTIDIDTAVFNSELRIAPNAAATVQRDRTLTINTRLENFGTLYMPSRNNHTYMDGAGWVENNGEIRAYRIDNLYDGYAHIFLPIHNAPAGKILLDDNGFMNFRNGSGLTNHGRFEARAGSRFIFTREGEGGEVVFKEGSQIIGPGSFQLYGSNRLVADGPITFSPHLELYNSSSVQGEGPISFTGQQLLRSVYNAPVVFAPGSEIVIENSNLAIFSKSLTVETNAAVTIPADRTLRIDGPLTNFGTIYMPSRNNHSYLTGAGRVENFGLFHVYRIGNLYDGYAHIFLPIHIAAGGKLLLDDNGWMQLRGGSSLSVSGNVEMRPGSRLLTGNENPQPQITMKEGGSISGSGQLMMFGATRLNLEVPTTLTTHFELYNDATVAGAGTLTLSGVQRLARSYNAPLRFASGAEVTIENATFNSPVVVEPGGNVYINADRTLTVNAPLTNLGAIHMASRNNHTYLNGPGPIENAGTFRVYRIGNLYDGYAHIWTPVTTTAEGKFLLDDLGWTQFRDGGELFMSGELEIRDGGKLLFGNEGPSRRLVFREGAVNTGPAAGWLEFHGGNRLVAEADIKLTSAAYLFNSTFSEGPGTISLSANQTLYGTWRSPVTIVSNTALNLDNVTFAAKTLVEPTAALNINTDRYLSVTDVVTNRGAINIPSQRSHAYLYGGGRIVNEGVFSIYTIGPNYGNPAHIYAHIHAAPGGRVVASTDAIGYFHAGSSLSASGVIEVQDRGSITLLNEFPWRDLTLMDGGELTGTGAAYITGLNRFVVEGTAQFSGGLVEMQQESQMGGTGTLVIGTNATLRFNHSANIDPNIELAGTLSETGGGIDLRFNNHLELVEGGRLNLPGTASAASFENNGGTVTGTLLVDESVTVTEWTAPAGGNWNSAGNWSAGVPDATKIARIALPGAYTIVIDSAASAYALHVGTNSSSPTLQIGHNLYVVTQFISETNSTVNFSSGVIQGNGAIRIRGAFNWSNGNINGLGPLVAESSATLNITGNNPHGMSRVFDNYGTVLWADGNIHAHGGGVINNRPGARWEAASDRIFYDGVFNNEGLFVKSSGAASDATIFGNSSSSNMRFNNSGVVRIDAGTLRLDNSGVHTGEFAVAAGARLWINGGSHPFTSESEIEGDGAFAISGGGATILGGYAMNGGTAVSGGTVDFSNGAINLPDLSVSGGTITGSAHLTATTDASWTGGTLSGSGEFTIAAGTTMNLTGSGDKSLSRILNNLGTINFAEGRVLASGGVVNNRAGAVWLATANGPFYDGIFNNEGSLIKSANPGEVYFGNAYNSNQQFNNSGLVDIQVGSIRFDNGGAHTGLFQVAANASLVFSSGYHPLSSTAAITGQGGVTVAGSANVSHAGAYTVIGGTTLAGGTLALENAATELPNFLQTGGTLAGAATVTLTTDAAWRAGTIAGSGTLVIPNGVTLRIETSNDHTLARVVENSGTISWIGGRILASGGTINNRVGSRFEMSADQPFYDGVLNNEGLVTKTAGASDNSSHFGNAYNGNMRFNNTGSVSIGAGVLRIENSGAHEGVFQIGTNAVLYMTGGSHSFSTNSAIEGEGVFDVNGANVTVAGGYAVTGGTSLRNGSITFNNGTNELANFFMSNGTLAGSADVIVTNAASWMGGTITGAGRFIIPFDVEVAIGGATDHTLARPFLNRGIVQWNAGRILANGGLVQNETGAQWNINCDSYFYDGVFNNAGAVTKTVGALTGTEGTVFGNAYTSNMRFNNSGAVHLNAGMLRFQNAGAHSGSFELGTNSFMLVNDGTHNFTEGSSISGDGELQLNNGTISIDGGAVTLPKFVMNRGTLTGSGSITFGVDSIWNAGAIVGSAGLTIPSGVTMTIDTSNDHPLARAVDNFGTIRWIGSGRIFANGGVINNKFGAIWDLAVDSYFFDGTVNNEGVIQRTAGGDYTYFDNYQGSVRFNNAGIVNVQSGGIRLRNSGDHAGVFQAGSGTTIIFENGSHTFADGSAMGGTGTIRIWRAITLMADLPCTTATIVFESSASVSGAFNMSNEPGGAFLFAKSMNIPGSMTVGGSIATGAASVQVILGGNLELIAGALVENPGLIQAADVIGLAGATVQGNDPIKTPVAPSLRVDNLVIDGGSGGKTKASIASAPSSIALVFSATTTARVAVETSTDLVHWTETPCQVAPIAGGKFEARVAITDGPVRWFRLRQIP